jgi:hypothetical protein
LDDPRLAPVVGVITPKLLKEENKRGLHNKNTKSEQKLKENEEKAEEKRKE